MSFIDKNREIADALETKKIKVEIEIDELDYRLFNMCCAHYGVTDQVKTQILSRAFFKASADLTHSVEGFAMLEHLRRQVVCALIQRELGWPNGRPEPQALQYD